MRLDCTFETGETVVLWNLGIDLKFISGFVFAEIGAMRGVTECTVGLAYLTLGRALQTQGKRDETRAALRSAAEHLQNALGPDHPDTRGARQLAELDTKDR